MEEFPGLVELHKKYPDDVACISISTDVYTGAKPEKFEEPVLKFLREQNATFDNVLSSTSESALYKAFGFPEGVVKPVVLVYGKDGSLARRFDSQGGEFTYEKDVAPFVAELVKK